MELLVPTTALTQLPFKSACEAWLDSRRAYISPKTFHEYQLNINTLAKFFEPLRLPEIDADLIRRYQKMRMSKCGPFSINHECSVLQQVLKRIGHWNTIADQFQPLPLPQVKRGMSISDEERIKLWRIMRANPNWDAARLAATISINTTASPGEAYKLKLQDIELEERKFWIGKNGAKNARRVRRVPINDECFDAFREAIARAKILGAYEPNHYLFPFRCYGREFDPERHQTTFKTAWIKIIKEAVRQGIGRLENCRLEDMRHSADTRLLENENISETTYEELAGHAMPIGKKFYSHIRMERKREAVDVLSAYRKPVQSEKSTGQPAIDENVLALAVKLAKLLNSA
jgi:integrase